MIAASLGGASSNGTSPGTVEAGAPKSFEAGSVQADRARRKRKRDGKRRRIGKRISRRLTQMAQITKSRTTGAPASRLVRGRQPGTVALQSLAANYHPPSSLHPITSALRRYINSNQLRKR